MTYENLTFHVVFGPEHGQRASINGLGLSVPVVEEDKGLRLVLDGVLPKDTPFVLVRLSVPAVFDCCYVADARAVYMRDILELLRQAPAGVDITSPTVGVVIHPFHPAQSIVLWGHKG